MNRHSHLGYCRVDDGLYVASVYQHHGEEPVLGGPRGVCNVFFAHCNLQCVYCQNYQISCNTLALEPHRTSLDELAQRIEAILSMGCDTLGLVSPTHYAPYIPPLLALLRAHGYSPTVVYNSNAYDSPEALALLNGHIDIYLPDYKYGSYAVALELSGAKDYPDYALDAIASMGKQVGRGLELDPNGIARRGLLVRHLVLPGRGENSKAALFNLWSDLGCALPISLMGQYGPAFRSCEYPELNRCLSQEEYNAILEEFDMLGFTTGFTQDLRSAEHYRPDFDRERVFE